MTMSVRTNRFLRDTYCEHVSSHFGDVCRVAVDPTLRPERIRVLAKDALVSIDDPAIHTDDGAFRDELSM
jgi:hypothetical protein